MIRRGDVVAVLPAWRDAGESDWQYVAVEDQDGDRVRLTAIGWDGAFPPRYVYRAEWLVKV